MFSFGAFLKNIFGKQFGLFGFFKLNANVTETLRGQKYYYQDLQAVVLPLITLLLAYEQAPLNEFLLQFRARPLASLAFFFHPWNVSYARRKVKTSKNGQSLNLG